MTSSSPGDIGLTSAYASSMARPSDFDHFHRDVQVLDLYYFLRKVMEKRRIQ